MKTAAIFCSWACANGEWFWVKKVNVVAVEISDVVFGSEVSHPKCAFSVLVVKRCSDVLESDAGEFVTKRAEFE
jgi:hypothetical protein